jgi:hypothetical protein
MLPMTMLQKGIQAMHGVMLEMHEMGTMETRDQGVQVGEGCPKSRRRHSEVQTRAESSGRCEMSSIYVGESQTVPLASLATSE